MGVQGLWGILEPTASPVSQDSLRGKVLAIDVSIWLHQAVKGYRDKDGHPLPNAHLLGLFHRICKLLHSGIRPVFVFDGGVPALKRQTMDGRRQKKIEASSKADSARRKLLTNYLQRHVSRQVAKALPPSIRMSARIDALGQSKRSPSKSPPKKNPQQNEFAEFEEFRQKFADRTEDDSEEDSSEYEEVPGDSEEEDFEESSSRNYADNFSTITSAHFDNLDLERQHEILFQMQESKKTNSWKKMGEMPREAGEFSSFQMDRLLKRRYLQKKILSVQKEMGQRHIHVQNLDELASYEAEFGAGPEVIGSKEKGVLFLKPKVAAPTANAPSSDVDVTSPSSINPTHSKPDSKKIEFSTSENQLSVYDDAAPPKRPIISEEETNIQRAIEASLERSQISSPVICDDDLQKAIQLSLEDCKERTARLSSPPKQVEIATRKRSPASAVEKPFEETIAKDLSTPCYKFLGWVGFNDRVGSPVKKISTSFDPAPTTHVPVTDATSSSDDDFEDVDDGGKQDEKTVLGKLLDSPNEPTERSTFQNGIQIRVKPIEDIGEDLFADIFKSVIRPNESAAGNSNTEQEHGSAQPIYTITSPSIEAEDQSEVPAKTENDEDDNDSDICQEKLAVQAFGKNEAFQEIVVKDCEDQFEDKGQLGSNIDDDDVLVQHLDFNPTEDHIPTQLQNRLVNQFTSDESSPSGIKRTLGQLPTQVLSSQLPPVRMITTDYLQQQDKLRTEKGLLQGEMGSGERLSSSITDQMYLESQELLSLFGIPFVVSPMEAEAQCAFLDAACLTDGTITDDSDVWLFGARRVYKNYFSQGDRPVQFFQYADIVRKLPLDREKFIVMAILCGSDYTNGIEGVGPVTALEIIGDEGFQGTGPFETLQNFYTWWSNAHKSEVDTDVHVKGREKWRKFKLPAGFPSTRIYDAYLNPTVDTSTEPFRWGTADLDALRHYAKQKFGWTEGRVDAVLAPALKNFSCQQAEIKRQSTLDSFLCRPQIENPASSPVGQSKRLRRAMQKLRKSSEKSCKVAPVEVDLSSESDSEGAIASDESQDSGSKRGKRKALAQTRSRGHSKNGTIGAHNKRVKISSDPPPGSSKGYVQARIPKGTASEIPQSAKSIETRKLSKEKAIETFVKKKETGK